MAGNNARVLNGVVVETTDDATAKLFPAGYFQPCPDAVVQGWLQNGGGFAPAVPVVSALGQRLQELAAERYRRETGGVYFKASGASTAALIATDAQSQAKITACFLAASSGHWIDGTPWKVVGGTFVPLASADMQAMALTILAYVAQCFANEAKLASALRSDLATDITQGWPSNGTSGA